MPEYIEIHDQSYADPNVPGGHDSRLHIFIWSNEIEQDDSEPRQSYLNMLIELDTLAAEVQAARDEVARRAGMKIVPGQRDRIRAAMVAHALNTLPRVGQAPDVDDPPCCSSECAPCSGLVQLHAGGLLDDWVRPYVADSGDGWDWWLGTVDGGHVDWEYVTARVCVDPAACSAPGQCLVRLDEQWLADSAAPPTQAGGGRRRAGGGGQSITGTLTWPLPLQVGQVSQPSSGSSAGTRPDPLQVLQSSISHLVLLTRFLSRALGRLIRPRFLILSHGLSSRQYD